MFPTFRGATRLTGGMVNAVLSGVAPLVGEQVSSRRREAMLAVLNGVLGDRLQDTANPLAIRISLHHEGQALPAQLKRLVFLGTPHHGAPLERQVVTRSFAKIGQIRSAGITDLRYGNVLEADWQHADQFESAPDARQVLPLPAGVSCYAVAATTVAHGVGPLAPVRHALSHKVVGDGLVPLESAPGQHEESRRSLAFAPQNQWIAHGMNQLDLLRRPEVTAQLLQWLGQSS